MLFGIDEAVALEMTRMLAGGFFSYDDMDMRTKVALKEFPSLDTVSLLQILQRTTENCKVNISPDLYLRQQMGFFR